MKLWNDEHEKFALMKEKLYTPVVGDILGGLFIGVVENLAVVVLPAVYKDIVSFVLLIIFLLVHPSGFLGKKA